MREWESPFRLGWYRLSVMVQGCGIRRSQRCAACGVSQTETYRFRPFYVSVIHHRQVHRLAGLSLQEG